MRPIVVVESQGSLERPLDLSDSRKVSPSELDAPVLVQECALDALDEAVRERMPGSSLRFPNTQFSTNCDEVALELAAAVGEDALQGPSCSFEIRMDLPEEFGGDRGSWIAQEDLRPGVRRGRVASRDLPDFADTLEFADVEAVEADQLSRFVGLDMCTGGCRTSLLERALGSLGEESCPCRAVLFQDSETLAARAQPVSFQGAVDRARRDMEAPQRQLIGDPLGSPSRLGERFGDDPSLERSVECGRPAQPPAEMLGVEAIGSILPVPIPKLVVERASHACLSAGATHVAEFFGSTEESQALKVYLLFEGHWSPSLVRVSQQERRRWGLMALFSL